jgi:hypothetical protein
LVLRQDDPEVQLNLLEAIARAMHFAVKYAEGYIPTQPFMSVTIPKGSMEQTTDLCIAKLINLMQNKVRRVSRFYWGFYDSKLPFELQSFDIKLYNFISKDCSSKR